jgi:multisubunit Na+/H+ antiporter MnhB subunit
MWIVIILVLVVGILISQNSEVTPGTAWETAKEIPLQTWMEPVQVLGWAALGAIGLGLLLIAGVFVWFWWEAR